MKVAKGAPYSATAEAETVQTLADGNRIRNKTATLVYRDGEGRTRREVVGKEQGSAYDRERAVVLSRATGLCADQTK